MTEALCFKCGNIKWGAICACPKCKGEASGNFKLDIAFSDHHMSRATLEKFGNFIKLLNSHSADNEICFWAFMRFISEKHPSISTAQISGPKATEVNSLLAKIEYPHIEIEISEMAQIEQKKAEKRAKKIERKRMKKSRIRSFLGNLMKRNSGSVISP